MCWTLTICACLDRIMGVKPEPIYKEIGRIIRTRRRGFDMAQEVLARQLGISRAKLANIETGRQRILVHQLHAIAKVLKVKLDDLIPTDYDEKLGTDWSALPIEGDLNIEQKKQVANLIGQVGTQPQKQVKNPNAKKS